MYQPTLAADAVRDRKIGTHRFRAGYSTQEVDDFFDRVEAELRRLHEVIRRASVGLPPTPGYDEPKITREQVDTVVFRPTRFRVGYDEEEVDNLIDEVAREFTAIQRFLGS